MKHMKKILAVALVALSIFAVALPALAQSGIPAGSNVYAISNKTNVRKGASLNDGIVDTLSAGESARVITSCGAGGWYYVHTNARSKYGYIREDTVNDGNSGGGTNPGTGIGVGWNIGNIVAVNGSNVNVRSAPNTSTGTVLYRAQNGDICEIGNKQLVGSYWWYLINNYTRNSGTYGWIRGDYIRNP